MGTIRSFFKSFRKTLLWVALTAVLLQPLWALAMTDEAAQLYHRLKDSVFQIRVIDLGTDEKSATGSGFYISAEGLLVTNYHVVSAYVHKPERYRIQAIKQDGSSADLRLVHIDVVHDLAILIDAQPTDSFLPLASAEIHKGERIFSMGNPHDLGMTIIEGTFNGLMEKSMYRKILFSGSLNPGMSGGPALNHNGEVIGVNVSTMGNDVSFLVPVEFLKKLYDQVDTTAVAPITDWDKTIEAQLLTHQEEFIASLLSSPWKKLTIDGASVPGEIADPIKCWGDTYDKEKDLMVKIQSNCGSEDSIFLSDQIYTAEYSFWFRTHKAKKMNTFRLYNHMESDFEQSFSYYNEDDEMFTKYQCNTDFVDVDGRGCKAVLCVRQYKRFKELYDIEFLVSTVDQFDGGLMSEFSAGGVSQKRAKDLVAKFLKEIQWQK